MATIKEVAATTVQINSPDHSWGIFCFNDLGDLFLNSDWGCFMFSWRSYAPGTFREFLSKINPEYCVGKFAINYRTQVGKQMPKHTTDAVTGLVSLFIQHLKDGRPV